MSTFSSWSRCSHARCWRDRLDGIEASLLKKDCQASGRPKGFRYSVLVLRDMG